MIKNNIVALFCSLFILHGLNLQAENIKKTSEEGDNYNNYFLPYTMLSKDRKITSNIENYIKDFYKSKEQNIDLSKLIDKIANPIKMFKLDSFKFQNHNVTIEQSEILYEDKKVIIKISRQDYMNYTLPNYTYLLVDNNKKLIDTIVENTKKSYSLNQSSAVKIISSQSGKDLYKAFIYKNKIYELKLTPSLILLTQLDKNGNNKPFASIKLARELSDFDTKEFAHLLALNKTLRTMLGNGRNFYDSKAKLGKNVFKNLIDRPWAVDKMDGRHYWSNYYNDKMAKCLKDWALKEIWNLREYDTLQLQIASSKKWLTGFYQDAYGMKTEYAYKKAKNNIEELIGAYFYFHPNYFKFRQNTNYKLSEDIISGKTDIQWEQFEKVKYGFSPQKSLLTTMQIDNAYLVKNPSEPMTDFGKTLLMYAAHMNNYDAVKTLVDQNTSINAVTKPQDGWVEIPVSITNRSALTYAAENGSIEVIKLLVEHGADTNIKDSKGNNLDFYIHKNPRFADLKYLNFSSILKRYTNSNELFKPSFDCDKASTIIEKEICTNKSLSIYDRELSQAYKNLKKYSTNKSFDKEQQSLWLKNRNEKCSKGTKNEISSCLGREYRSQTRFIFKLLAEYNQYKFQR